MSAGPVKSEPFVVADDEAGQTVASILRRHGVATTWSEARSLVERGKVYVSGRALVDPVARLDRGASVELRPTARRPKDPLPPGRIVYDDPQLVVFDKPTGVSSVPYEDRESGTAMDLIRDHWKRTGKEADTALHVVHRIDKETSGLLVFAKTKTAERVLAAGFRAHEIERTYLCIVHGTLTDRRIESRLVEDRGDGLRGSTRDPKQGKRAITHVKSLGPVGKSGELATLCEVRLETGKTHQIRIHLSENGHPLVGEKVYIRDFLKKEKVPLPSPRLLLHAATLGFPHPLTKVPLRFESPLPPDFEQEKKRLERGT